MSVIERVPTSTRGRWLTLSAVVVVWVLAYRLNGRLWDWLLYDVSGMDPERRATETLHFFVYDSVKILLLL